MANEISSLFLTLPIEIFYRILDKLDVLIIVCSMANVCMRFNAMLNGYHRYQVKPILGQIVIRIFRNF